MPEPAPAPLVETRGVTKRFGAVTANEEVDFAIAPGEIHALLGENGAGKSTFVKILYGALQPDSGTILWNGAPVAIADPKAARRLGIGMVFQHFSLFEALTVAENVALALGDGRGARSLSRDIEAVAESYGLPVAARREVHELSVGERQRVEIVRCLLQEPRLLIMDEPTSVLTPQEAEILFATLEKLAASNCSILYISHRLEEVKRLCHRATILRQGRVETVCDPARETAASMARRMVGADVRPVRHAAAQAEGPVRLALDGLDLPADGPFAVALRDVALEVRGGEIVAIAGVAGNGQGELFRALSGERPAPREAVLLEGAPAGDLGINRRRAMGAAFVPEERLGHGAVPRMTLSENVVLTRHATSAVARAGFVRMGEAARLARAVGETFDVRKGADDPEAASLSGGNLQKFVVGREILAAPGILVVNQPTWGVDAGAARAIRQALVDMAEAGAAILVLSQDLDEIMEIADRIAVLSHGRLSEARPAREMSLETIGLLMGGARPEGEGGVDAA